MANQDQSFLDDLEKADPGYKFAKEYLAGLGVDIDSGKPMMARTPNYDPEVMGRLGINVVGQGGVENQYAEPAGPPSPFNEFGQPVGSGGFYRRMANKVARGAGFVARGVAAGMGMTAPNLQKGAYEIGEGATRGILTQAVPGVAELPQNVMRWSEDMGGLAKMGMVEVMRTMADFAGKKGDATGAQEFYDQAAILESANPRDVFVASDVMEKGLAKVVNQPASEGERAWRDAFSILTAMVATKNVGPTVGAQASKAAKLVESAIRGGITDFVVSDPRRSGAVEGTLSMFSPELADKARNYVSSGGVAEEEDLKLHLARRVGEVAFGAVTGTMLDSLMAGFKQLRLSRLADDWRGVEQAAADATIDPAAEVATFIDNLRNTVDEPALQQQLDELKLQPLEVQQQTINQMMEGVNDVERLPGRLNEEANRVAGVERMGDEGAGMADDEGASMLAGEQDIQGRIERLGQDITAQETFAGVRQPAVPGAEADELFESLGQPRAGAAEPGVEGTGPAFEPEMLSLDELDQAEDLFKAVEVDDARPISQTLARGNEQLRQKVMAVASEPTHEQYPDVARALNQPVEQSAVEIALSTQPFPQSQVTNAVFQGTGKVFKEHSDEMIGSADPTMALGRGHYFTDSGEVASTYPSRVTEGEARNVRKAYLDIRKPYVSTEPVDDALEAATMDAGMGHLLEPDMTKGQLFEALKAEGNAEEARLFVQGQGFDGIVWPGSLESTGEAAATTYLVFSAKQVKNGFGSVEEAAQQLMKAANPPAQKAASPAAAVAKAAPQAAVRGPVTAQSIEEYVGNLQAEIRSYDVKLADKKLDRPTVVRLEDELTALKNEHGALNDILEDLKANPSDAYKAQLLKEAQRRIQPSRYADQGEPSQAPAETAAKAPSTRKPRGEGAGMKQAKLVAERLEKGESSPASAVAAIARQGKLNDKKAAEMLMRVLEIRNSPIIQSIANHPDVQKALGGAALVTVLTWALGNPAFMKAIEEDLATNERDAA